MVKEGGLEYFFQPTDGSNLQWLIECECNDQMTVQGGTEEKDQWSRQKGPDQADILSI